MIKLAVFDFDGVFSDGKFYFGVHNSVTKCYNGKDSLAIKMLKKEGVKTALISKDTSNINLENALHLKPRFDFISCGSESSKLHILLEWISKLNITLREVAYIGDDTSDIELLEHCGYSGCPLDAISSVKQTCIFISKYSGGSGAVREFAESIIEKNQQKDKITAIIPVRKGSKRCIRKNSREFGHNSSLLKEKILTLKKVNGLDGIIVTSDCDDMLRLAKELGVLVDKRPAIYAADNKACPASSFFRYLATICPTGTLMHAPCTSPFVSVDTYEQAIKKWKEKSSQYDSINSVSECLEFLWNQGKPLNYDAESPPNSQDLPDIQKLNFGFNIIAKSTCLRRSNVVGIHPMFVHLSEIESQDIDTQLQFDMCNYLQKSITTKPMNKTVLLDCTIRDGGYLCNWSFSDEFVKDAYNTASSLGYSYFEIGFRSSPELLPGKGKWCYSTDESIRTVDLPVSNCKLAVMAKIGTVNLSDFKPKSQSQITMVRVLVPRYFDKKSIFHKEVIVESVTFLKGIINLGYEATINIPNMDMLTFKDIELLSRVFLPGLKCIYLADTFGNASIDDIKSKMEMIRKKTSIPLGIHAHNNAESAMLKTQKAMEFGVSFVDTCLYGLGRGSGNLKTEVFYCETRRITQGTASILFTFIDTHILSKKEYSIQKYAINHPLYCLSKFLGIHPNYIDNVLNKESTIQEDIISLYSTYEQTKN